MKKIPIILDCDPGVDDSFAIALAHASDCVELLAITPVGGNVPAELTRRNALGLAQQLGIDCRVAFGAEHPLYNPHYRPATATHGSTGVGSVIFEEITKAPDPLPAWEVIYQEAVAHSGELVLLAVGPLTNIAACLRLHPDLPQHLRRFVIMGGGTFGNVPQSGRTAEFNIWVDATSAAEVFEKMEVWMVGLNATHAAAVEMQDFDEMMALCGDNPHAAIPRALAAFSKENCQLRGRDNNVIHDAVAVASVIDPDLIGFEEKYVYVEADYTKENAGQTVIGETGEKGNLCHLAMTVDQPRFVRMMKDMCRWYGAK